MGTTAASKSLTLSITLACALVALAILPVWSLYFDVVPKVAILLAATAIWIVRIGQ
ncbi:MAG TPA: hypothetical protein VML19_32645 [Verrucomicrobiae bacterium]|nr:hypothetical protein [Verrucomicrobiae bacterium]